MPGLSVSKGDDQGQVAQTIPQEERLFELYMWGDCEQMIDTQYGVITYLEWLRREKTRIELGDGRVAVVKRAGKLAALYANDVTGD